jgi:RNA polymerase sigma factor (sigma-70 family)
LFGFGLLRVLNGEPTMTDSLTLLAEYAKNSSESAFRELVSRYVNLVQSTALRMVGGDTHLAEDVAQTVFLDLARKAPRFPRGVILGGWLHRHTCYVACKTVRAERRRQARERQAAEMNVLHDDSTAGLDQLAPILDDAICHLEPEDRAAIVLRFFEQRDFRSVGQELGSSEDAARMRVNRALQKLHLLLSGRGLALSAATLGTALASEATRAAPAGLAASIASAALVSGPASAGVASTIINLLTMTKMKVGLIGTIVVAAAGIHLVADRESRARMRTENDSLRSQLEPVNQLVAENGRLSNLLSKATGAKSLEAEQMAELLRLRGEVGRLRRLLAEQPKSQGRLATLARSGTNEVGMAGSQGNFVAASDWTNRGFASPQDTAISFLWALRAGDAGLYAAAQGKTNIPNLFPVPWAAAFAEVKGSYVSEVIQSDEGDPMVGLVHELPNGEQQHTWLGFKESNGSWQIKSLTGFPIVLQRTTVEQGR